MERALLGPVGAVPRPRVAVEQHDRSVGGVVGHRRERGSWAVSRTLLGPIRAVPGPRVAEASAGVVAPAEEDDLLVGRVVRHRGALPGRGGVGRTLLGPGRAVPGPRVVAIFIIIALRAIP